MTTPLRDLIEEWEAVNSELYAASLESHRRYPFPSHLFNTNNQEWRSPAFSTSGAAPSPTVDCSTAAYTRVYHFVSRLRYVAEDARYNSFQILQQLLWVTVVAWANQLAIASGGVIRLPTAVHRHQHHHTRSGSSSSSVRPGPFNGGDVDSTSAAVAATAGTSARTSFPCALLPLLSFWDPGVLAETAVGSPSSLDSGVDSPTSTTATPTAASAHRPPNLPAVWADAVQRIFTLWCTPTSATPAAAATAATTSASPSTESHLADAYVWVLLAQHYHRFKAVLSLVFLRYDAHLEELEEEQRQRGQRQQPQQRTEAVGEDTAAAAASSASIPTVPLLRRRGPHLRVTLDVSATSAQVPPQPPRTTQSVPSATVENTTTTIVVGGSNDRRRPAEESTRRSSLPPLPTTGRLLALLVRTIETENLLPLTSAIGEVLLVLLMPPVHRGRLRAKVLQAQQQQRGEGPLTAPEEMASVFLDGGAEDEEEDEDDDKVVWSAPPSPLLSFSTATAAVTVVSPPPVPSRAQQEEYVMRNVFKLLLMSEDCRVYALQHWLVEAGKHVAAVYGAQLASLFFEEPCDISADTKGDGSKGDGRSTAASAAATPALTVRTLADANRVLRETLQSYVRLRTRLLFLNAGTTHFLEALTPWGRTRMLENLNAFLCGFCGVKLPSSASTAAAGGSEVPTTLSDAEQYFTPTNAAVAAFTRTWGVPLWLAMCDDTQLRLDALQGSWKKRTEPGKPTSDLPASVSALGNGDTEEAEGEKRDSAGTSEGIATSPHPRSPSFSGRYKKEPTCSDTTTAGAVVAVAASAEQRSITDGRAPSVASADLGDAVSRAPSGKWPPTSSSPTTGAARAAAHAMLRGHERKLNLRRVLEQQQQQRRRSAEGFVNNNNNNNSTRRAAGTAPLAVDGGHHSSDGGGGLEGSLYSAETFSVGEGSNVHAGATGNSPHAHDGGADTAGATVSDGGYRGERSAIVLNSVEAAVAAARQRRRRAAAVAAQTQRTILGAPGTTQRFSRAAQLHQVATLPDEGFPSLLYLVPRRSRFLAQDKAAAAVQQELFTRFSSDVHHYLTVFLAECEAAESAAAGGNAAAVKGSGKSEKRSKKEAAAAAEGGVRPLPPPVLARMIFLLDMTYTALQGSGDEGSTGGGGGGDGRREGADSRGHHHATGPLMETGLTTTGQETGAAILEQVNGEYESVVSTTLSAPTSPAVLTVAAVRKGYQGFLSAQEKRAVLTLAQALHKLVQETAGRSPAVIPFEAVDTILNMAALLNSKDMFVSLLKGYLAPRVMMCRSLEDFAVESQVVARLAYRLGSAVAAPCLTLLRDLRLALSDPFSPAANGPCALTDDNDFYGDLPGGAEGSNTTTAATAPTTSGTTAVGARLVANRDAQTLAAAGPLRHRAFGLIHHMRILCQAWWQPHTAALLPSRKLQRLWERYQLLDERLIDAVLRVEWRYDGHTGPFYGYGRIPGDPDDAYDVYGDSNTTAHTRGGTHTRSNTHDSAFSGPLRGSNSYQHHHSASAQSQHYSRPYSARGGGGGSLRGSASAAGGAGNARRGGAAAAVIQGFSSALNSAVRRTGHHAGAFGNNESDNESEDYSEAYGGLLTLNTLQRHRGSYAASTGSFRGSNLSSHGGGGGTGDYWDVSDGGQSTVPDAATSTNVLPDGERERRQLRWPLGDGQLVFLLLSKTGSTATPVQIVGPPLTLLVCQLLDRAARDPYSFDKLHKALPVQTPKPLLAHLMHELVKAGVVTRSVAPGTRHYVYALCEDVQHVRQRKVVIDVTAAAQQHWVTRTLTATDSEAEEANQMDPMSPASPAGAVLSFPSTTANATTRRHQTEKMPRSEAGGAGKASANATAADAATSTEPSSPAYTVERTHKIKVCIVRIMKAERVLTHRELLEKVALALEDQFVVTSSQLKRCVAQLMEKEFLQRSESGEEYMYVS